MDASKPPKKKIVGYAVKRKPGAIVKQGAPATTSLDFEKGSTTRKYEPTKIETGHKAYGKPGGGTDKEMNALISDAQSKRRDVTDHSSKGLNYKAGTTTETKTPAKFHTSIDVKPTIRKVEFDKTPIVEKGAGSSSGHSGGRLKPMAVTMGGSDRRGNPANKSGVGKGSKIKIRKVTSFKK